MAFTGMVLTNLGLVLQAKVQAGTALAFTKLKVGNGMLGTGQTLETLTDLISPQRVVPITSCSVVSGQATISGTLSNTGVTAGYMVNEIGVFATDPQAGEILYAVANAGGQCDYLPAGGGATVVESILNVVLAVGNATSVTANINTAIYVTQAQLAAAESAAVQIAGGGTLTSGTITLYQAPVNPMDAATKEYVDALAQGLSPKSVARVATTGNNITLSGLQTIDGVALAVGDRVLVKDQTAQSQNGIYLAETGVWTRSLDADTGPELVGAFLFVDTGTTNGGSAWFQQTVAPITIGTSSIMWGTFQSATAITATGALQRLGNIISVITGGITSAMLATGAAIANIGYTPAKPGTNSDITSLTGLTTALPVSEGGTGAQTASAALDNLGALPLAGGNMSGAINEAAVTMASAATMNIGAAAGNFIRVTGTTAITSFGIAQGGTRRTLRFMDSGLVVTYSASLQLPRGVNIAVSAGDIMTFAYDVTSACWTCTDYQPIFGNAPGSFGLGSPVTTSADANTLTYSGFYYCTTSANIPTTYTQLIVNGNGSDATQIAINVNSGIMYTRRLTGGTWLAWKQITTADQFNDYVVAESLGTNGYRKWNSGLIEQWGNTSIVIGTNGSVTFPTTFPNAVYFSPVVNMSGYTGSNGYIIRSTTTTTSGFSYVWDSFNAGPGNGLSCTINYYVIGH